MSSTLAYATVNQQISIFTCGYLILFFDGFGGSKFQDMFILDTNVTNVEDRRVSAGTIYRKIDIQIVALGVHIDVQYLLEEIIFGDARHK